MTIDPATGVISWTPTAVGSFNVMVRVSNSFGDDTQSFMIVVTDPASEVIIDDGRPGTTAVGAWSVSYGTGPYGTQSLYSFSTTATYTFGIERSGLQDVYLWWTEHETRQTAVPVRIYDNGTLLATVYVNQKLNGGKWNYIGSYTFSGLAQVRIVSTSKTLSTCADAARFVPGNPAGEVIIDDGQPGTTAVGAWSVSYGTGPYGTQSLYSFSTTATYTFGIERSGLQDVYLWWTEHETRHTAVPVRIYDNGTLLATVYVNQKLNGGKWNYMGSYTFSGLAQVQIVSTSKTLSTCADAARFVP